MVFKYNLCVPVMSFFIYQLMIVRSSEYSILRCPLYSWKGKQKKTFIMVVIISNLSLKLLIHIRRNNDTCLKKQGLIYLIVAHYNRIFHLVSSMITLRFKLVFPLLQTCYSHSDVLTGGQ